MRIVKLGLIACLLISSFACEKEDIESALVFFSGITERDNVGNLNGSIDPMDWTLDATFTSRENALFPADNLPICSDASDTIFRVYSYPNPSQGIFAFGSLVQMDRIALRIVDDNFNILFKEDSLTSQTLTINEDEDGGSRVVRLYYRVYNGGCKYQGYGDLSIN